MERLTKDSYYLGIAYAVAQRSTCLKRKYGCVIVKNDEIVSTGYNGSPRGCTNCCDVGKCLRTNAKHNTGSYFDCTSVHAEQNAMLSASRAEMLGATMYLVCVEPTHVGYAEVLDCVPCHICARMVLNAGIAKVINSVGEVDVYGLVGGH